MAKQKDIKPGIEQYYPRKRSPLGKGQIDLIEELRKLKVSSGEALRIIRRVKLGESTRYNWKMLRFTMYLWERVRQLNGTGLTSKIDTIKEVVKNKFYQDLYYGYFPEAKINYDEEVKNLNKLVAEKKQRKFFKEGYFYYKGTSKLIPQDIINKVHKPPNTKK